MAHSPAGATTTNQKEYKKQRDKKRYTQLNKKICICATQKATTTTTQMAKGNFYIKMLIEVVKKTNKRKSTYKKRWVDKYSCWLHEKWPTNEKSKQIWITRYAIYLFIYLSSFANFQAVCSKALLETYLWQYWQNEKKKTRKRQKMYECARWTRDSWIFGCSKAHPFSLVLL